MSFVHVDIDELRRARAARLDRLEIEPDDVDGGAVDGSVQLLFGMVVLLLVFLVVLDITAYWHTRNVFDDAAADGARVAAAYDGSCATGVEATRAAIARQVEGWADDVDISCTDGPEVSVAVRGASRGVLFAAFGVEIDVVQTQPSER